MNNTPEALTFCRSTPLIDVTLTSEEWIMIAFVCVIVFFFTGKRLVSDMKGWVS